MSHYNYLHGFLSWHYLDEDICKQLDKQFKNYKIKFLNIGIHNDEIKRDKFIKIVNSKKTNLDKNIKEELIKCMSGFRSTCADDNPTVSRASKMLRILDICYFGKALNENLVTDDTLSVFNRIYFIADFIKERIKLADDFLTRQNKSRISRISKSRFKMNNTYYDTHENYKEQQIKLINEGCYDDFTRYKKVLRKWKFKNFKELYAKSIKNTKDT